MHNMTDRWSNVRPLEIVLSAKLLRIEEYKQRALLGIRSAASCAYTRERIIGHKS